MHPEILKFNPSSAVGGLRKKLSEESVKIAVAATEGNECARAM